jgi:hypothetical protein
MVNTTTNYEQQSLKGEHQRDYSKSKQFSKTLATVWLNAVRFLLEVSFKEKDISLYFKNVKKMLV